MGNNVITAEEFTKEACDSISDFTGRAKKKGEEDSNFALMIMQVPDADFNHFCTQAYQFSLDFGVKLGQTVYCFNWLPERKLFRSTKMELYLIPLSMSPLQVEDVTFLAMGSPKAQDKIMEEFDTHYPGSESIGARKVCDKCKQPGKFKCSKCKKSYYCCVDCQTKDWARHKKFCKKIRHL
uniref:MYND-type domain-containing protein n=1 Tax=viral metagenome TaxID=1070528 RepID=A0A6C0CFK4_9ZZZZ